MSTGLQGQETIVKAKWLVTERSHVSFVTINTVIIIILLRLLSHQSIYICYSDDLLTVHESRP